MINLMSGAINRRAESTGTTSEGRSTVQEIQLRISARRDSALSGESGFNSRASGGELDSVIEEEPPLTSKADQN